jgi:hypothetical protein
MSIADLKMRLADVQGIETLSMPLEAGRILLRWGAGYSATVDAAASDGEIETAIRSAIRLPARPLSLKSRPGRQRNKTFAQTLKTSGRAFPEVSEV